MEQTPRVSPLPCLLTQKDIPVLSRDIKEDSPAWPGKVALPVRFEGNLASNFYGSGHRVLLPFPSQHRKPTEYLAVRTHPY